MTILPPEFNGVMYITGLRGQGKSTLAAQADVPANMLFIDLDDGKGRGLDNQLHFGRYIDATAEMAKKYGSRLTAEDAYNYLSTLIDSIKPGFTVCVIDNIDALEQGLLWEVKQNPQAYNLDPQKVKSGAFGGAWPGVNNLVSGYVSKLHSTGVRLVIAIAHTKGVWGAKGIVPNKWKPRGVERWQQMSILTLELWLAENAPVPSAIVRKEALGEIYFDPDKQDFSIRRRLPTRIPACTFGAIRRYLATPADLEHPAPGEQPTAEELQAFGDKFSKEQLAYMTAMAYAAETEADQAEVAESANGNNNGGAVSGTIPSTLGELISRAGTEKHLEVPDLLAKLGVKSVSDIKSFEEAWGKL